MKEPSQSLTVVDYLYFRELAGEIGLVLAPSKDKYGYYTKFSFYKGDDLVETVNNLPQVKQFINIFSKGVEHARTNS